MIRPDLIVGDPANPYLLRWELIRFRGWQLALHKILRSDDERALHDHRGDNWSFILREGYYEVLSHAWQLPVGKRRKPGHLYFRVAEQPHRLVLTGHKPCWTLWLRAPERRRWGFHCQNGWRDAEEYLRSENGRSIVGKGCDD